MLRADEILTWALNLAVGMCVKAPGYLQTGPTILSNGAVYLKVQPEQDGKHKDLFALGYVSHTTKS
jgi:hypothetical protein